MSGAAGTISALMQALSLPRDEADTERLLGRILSGPEARIVSFVNAHAVNLAVKDDAFVGALRDSDFLLRDGMGVKLGCLLLNLKPGPNLNGTDLIPKLIGQFRDRKIALFGAEQCWLDQAAARLHAQGGLDLVTLDGFRPEEDYIARLCVDRPALVVLAMGMPKQELLARRLRAAARSRGISALIVNGGAIIDFIAGKVPRAPAWIRRAGMEWAFRLAHEPARLAKRYLLGNPLFLWRVCLVRLLRSAPPVLVKD